PGRERPRSDPVAIGDGESVTRADHVLTEMAAPTVPLLQPGEALLHRGCIRPFAQHHGQIERSMPLRRGETADAVMVGTRAVERVKRAAGKRNGVHWVGPS